VDGFSFYEAQAIGVGQYFLDSLYSDIDYLALYAGIHRKKSKDFHWMLSKRFRMPFITLWQKFRRLESDTLRLPIVLL